MLKMGTYGFMRFVIPIFPEASEHFAKLFMILGVIGVIYGALVAMVQPDLKKLVAYSSVSHMGYIVLGLFALNIYGATGAGAANRIAYWSGTSALTSSTNLQFDGTNLGIGSTAPAADLHVNGTDSRVRIQATGTTNYAATELVADGRTFHIGVGGSAVSNGVASKLYIYDNNASAMRLVVDTSGGVSLGGLTVVPSGSTLSVGSSAGNAVNIGTGDPATGMWIRNDGSNTVISTNVGNMYYGYAGSTKNLYFFNGGTTSRLTIDSSGNTSTSGTLTAGSTFTANAGVAGSFGLLPSYASWNAYGTGGGGAGIYNSNEAVYQALMIVGNNSAGGSRVVKVWDVLAVQGSGSTTSDFRVGGNAPVNGWLGAGCEGYCNSSGGYALLYADGHTDFGDGTNAIQIYPGNGGARITVNAQGVNQPYIGFAGNNTAFGCPVGSCGTRFASNIIIYGTGTDCTIGNGTGATSCTSDSRLKHDIQNTSGNLLKITQLDPVTFYTNLDPANKRIGLIAQNVLTQFPEAVSIDGQGFYQLDYGVLVSPLIGATKELKVIIDNMDSRLSVLESGNFSGNLHVAGYADILGDLTVHGDTTLTTLTVTGDTEVQDITVNGKIITAGATPTVVLGTQATGNGAVITLTGNDTAGTITYEAGTETLPTNPLSAGEQVGVSFTASYTQAPRIALTAKDADSAAMRYYVETTDIGFIIHFIDTPVAGATYSFDYIVIQ
jgi:hypothetical protein